MVSCQIKDDNAPSPDEAFIKYYGELTSYEASDIEIVYNATGEVPESLIVFGTVTTERGDDDYFILQTDLVGNVLASTSFGLSDTLDLDDDGLADDWTGDGVADRFRADEIAGQIQHIPGLGYAIIGSSAINISALGVSDWKWLSYGFVDEALQPITTLGDTLLFDLAQNNAGELLDIVGNDIITLPVGEGVLLVGGEEFGAGGSIHFDNFYTKISLSDGVVFNQIQGISGAGEDDLLVRAFEKSNGNLVMIGNSNTPSLLGENGGNNGTNVFYLETDPNGTPVNSAAYGLADPANSIVFNEEVNDVIKTTSGFSIVGTSSTSQNQQFAFIMNLSNGGTYLNSNSHDSSAFTVDIESAPLETIGEGVTQAIDNDLILLGQYLSFVDNNLSRGNEGLFTKFDQASNPVEGEESFFGLSDGDDTIIDAVTLPDGKIVAVANVDFGGGVKLISIIKLNADGSLD
ncbi:hypothetical protein [Nonlabens ulvanivorans]|uniref:hypothetical protein n=1 Tax=Nonlabens ulvanivorans TaxID=906888 RepID=UPI003297F8B4